MNKQISEEVVEEVAIAIYTDSYTQYGTCSKQHWKETSWIQRNFCRGQAIQALTTYLSIMENK